LDVSISSGAIFLTPAPIEGGKLVRKGKLKVYAGKIPKVDVEDAVREARNRVRL
jgi:hypothetical protein